MRLHTASTMQPMLRSHHLPSSKSCQARDSAALCRVRHEAGEALGAIGTPECLEQLKLHISDPCLEVGCRSVLSVEPAHHQATHL